MRYWNELNIQEFASLLHGSNNELPFPKLQKVCTDTRILMPGDVFFALKGENFDGNQFVSEALQKKASLIVLDNPAVFRSLKAPAICVEDSVKALGILAAYHRECCKATVIGITGSNGKTTTKDILYQLLASTFTGIKSEKSFNNFIGVPLTLLSLSPKDQFAVVEMGTNHPGEIAYLQSIVKPDLALITSIGSAHLEGFGTVENVAKEKISIAKGVSAFFYSEQETSLFPYLTELKASLFPIGSKDKSEIYATDIQCKPYLAFRFQDEWPIETSLMGTHNLGNFLLAIAVARHLEISIPAILKALSTFKGPKMRMETHNVGELIVINDAYNANPISMRAAIETLSQLPEIGRKILVAGEMGELGETSTKSHRLVGEYCVSKGLDQVLTFGEKAKAMHLSQQFHHFGSHLALLDFLKEELKEGDTILFKGSRTNQLEKVVSPLIEYLSAS